MAADHAGFEWKVQRDALTPDFAGGDDGRSLTVGPSSVSCAEACSPHSHC